MANGNTTSAETSNGSWIPSPKWVNRLSVNISCLFSPTTSSADAQATHKRTNGARPETWHVSSETLVFPQVDIPSAATAPPVRQPSRSRSKKERPPMPTGEHNAAARSRMRHKAERRGDRSRSRRPELNPTQSLRSSRRHSSASHKDVPQIMGTEELRAQKQKNRKSSPLPLLPPSQVMSAEDLRQLKEFNRRSSPLPLALEAIPASPDVPQCQNPWTADEQQCMERAALHSRLRRAWDINSIPISPKTRYPMPTVLSPPIKSSSTTFENHIPVGRKKRDIDHVPASAKWYLWHIFVDEKAPMVLTQIQVDRRYSRGVPASGWSLDTPTPRILGLPPMQRPEDMRAHSRDFSGNIYGRRKYDRDSGYWGWAGSLL